MKPISVYTVSATLPSTIIHLNDIARNFWWCWNAEARSMFRSIHPELWEEVLHNPVALLNHVGKERLVELSNDKQFVNKVHYIHGLLQEYLHAKTWYTGIRQPVSEETIAYFSLEFGISESFPNYSGGLGILAGDHLKSASDLGLPLVAVGLLYQRGYFRQHITQSGWQSELYFENDFYSMPLELMRNGEGKPHLLAIDLPMGKAYAHIWRTMVGRTALYLLNTNIQENADIPVYRDITNQLYGGNTETRIMQEILLGIGGIAALRLLGIIPSVIHINEGHAAFATLERARNIMHDSQVDFFTAMEIAHAGMIFTTHTPVPAGNEVFAVSLIEQYFYNYWNSLGITREEFIGLGQAHNADSDIFSMTVLALRMSSLRNGVSKLHGTIARSMWQALWKNFPESEIPIGHITNGIHTATWIGEKLGQLYDQYLSTRWRTETHDSELWTKVQSIPSHELWDVHSFYKTRLVQFTRSYLLKKEGAIVSSHRRSAIHSFLNPEALTIGFARRFATYKRANLLFRDMPRLKSIVSNPERPVQIIIAGKAHPHDTAGKEMIQNIIHKVREYGLENHIVFLEDYTMAVARAMVKGCDIWLNTPRRPHEASGTSGMKAAMNGCIHVSILDGWWDEAYNGDNGFAIGGDEEFQSTEEQDMVESQSLYEVLENSIIPVFFDRSKKGIPEEWVMMMKNSITTIAPQFSTARMVRDYTQQYYIPALQHSEFLRSNNALKAKELHEWKYHIVADWPTLTIQNVRISIPAGHLVNVGESIDVHVEIHSEKIEEHELCVEVFYGPIQANGEISNPQKQSMKYHSQHNKNLLFVSTYACDHGGQHGFAVRVVPKHDALFETTDLGLCLWANNNDNY